MATQKRARRAARHDPRYAGQRHEAATWTRRMAAKIDRELRIKINRGRKA